MDLRTLTKLALKLAGLYILLNAIVAIPSIVTLPKPYDAQSAISLVVYFLVGVALLRFPGTITTQIVRIPASELEGAVTAARLLQVGCILLGVYFAVSAVYGFVYTYAKARWFYDVVKPFPTFRGPDIAADSFADLVANAVEFVLGLCLWFGSRLVARTLGDFKDDR